MMTIDGHRLLLTTPSIFLWQFLARLGIQDDLADLAAIVLTPTLVSAFCWRDGRFVLQGTGIVVRRCDLHHY